MAKEVIEIKCRANRLFLLAIKLCVFLRVKWPVRFLVGKTFMYVGDTPLKFTEKMYNEIIDNGNRQTSDI